MYYKTFNPGATVSNVTIKKDKMFALKGTNISCTITLNTIIGPDYSALNVTWTNNGSQYGQDTMQLQSSTSRETSTKFTSVLTINSNEPSGNGRYCCFAAVIGSGDSDMMDCVTLNVLGKLILCSSVINRIVILSVM